MHSSSSLSLSQPERTLRRKQRMTLLKQKSSRSLRARASAPLLNVNANLEAPRSSTPAALTPIPIPIPIPIPMQQQAPATVRLGHPSRPYYTAIRPNSMSRPSSPFGSSAPTSPSASRAPSPSFLLPPHSVPNCTPAQLSDTATLRPYQPPTFASSQPSYQGANAHVNGNPIVGFSLSGETELRMALARLRSEENGGEPGSEYRFREMAGGSSDKGGSGTGKFRGKMKRLGMGIMELVLGRK